MILRRPDCSLRPSISRVVFWCCSFRSYRYFAVRTVADYNLFWRGGHDDYKLGMTTHWNIEWDLTRRPACYWACCDCWRESCCCDWLISWYWNMKFNIFGDNKDKSGLIYGAWIKLSTFECVYICAAWKHRRELLRIRKRNQNRLARSRFNGDHHTLRGDIRRGF